MGRRAALSALAALLPVVGALAGCTSDDGSGDPQSATPSPSEVVTPTADPQAARLQALAELAEEQAAELPPSPSTTPRKVPSGRPVLGADISWPQCPEGLGIPERRTLGLPLPTSRAEYVVIGLTNGPGFTANPCLADQVAWVRDRGLPAAAYAVVSRPSREQVGEYGERGPYDGGTRLGRLANTGYQQALANVATMRHAGLASPIVWLDVEPVPDFEWSDDLVANAAVVEGAARGYTDAGYRIGVYSTPLLWAEVVGDLALGVPEWRAAGESSRREALSRCGDDWQIQGGDAVMAQWLAGNRDLNVTCPGVTDLSEWFS